MRMRLQRFLMAGCLLAATSGVYAGHGYLVAAGVPPLRFRVETLRLPLADVLPPLPRPEPAAPLTETNQLASATNTTSSASSTTAESQPVGAVTGPTLTPRDLLPWLNGVGPSTSVPMFWSPVLFTPPQPPVVPSRATYTLTPKTP